MKSFKELRDYYETNEITEVSENEGSYFVSCGVVACVMGKEHGSRPKVGDFLTVHTKGGAFGTIRGMHLNGQLVFWKTDEELDARRQKELDDFESQKQKEFAENKDKMDEQYNSLPKCFQDRIDRFRANNSRFRIDYEPYELFCCEEAVKIANALKTKEKLQAFTELGWDQQMEEVPSLSDQHSGNTFGAACNLAYLYLSQPENVAKMHGSLSPLVGSDEYGDFPK